MFNFQREDGIQLNEICEGNIALNEIICRTINGMNGIEVEQKVREIGRLDQKSGPSSI